MKSRANPPAVQGHSQAQKHVIHSQSLMLRLFNHGSLWLAMYSVTLMLFWWKTGSWITGLMYGLIAATLKSFVAVVHHRLWDHALNFLTDNDVC